MKQAILIFIIGFLFYGCGSGDSSSTNTETTNISEDTSSNITTLSTSPDYIEAIPEDTTVVSKLAISPHTGGEIKTLVILVEYDNQPLSTSTLQWEDKIFGYNDKELNNYFQEVSKKKFKLVKAEETDDIANDGIIKVHLNKNHLDTDINSIFFAQNLFNDLNEAIAKSDTYIDYSKYDLNNDGYITTNELAVIFVIAGYEDAFEGRHVTNGVWGHQSAMSTDIAPVADGVKLFNKSENGKYAVFGELHDETSPHIATIGIIAHELGHAIFNLPDLYNTTGSTGGIGYFGLMGAGLWTTKDNNENPGDTPAHLCAWSKTFVGWVTPIELQNTSTKLIQTSSKDYNVIKIPISANHYYLLENRNDSGYDRGLRESGKMFQGGVAIWHINQEKLTVDYFESNTVNSNTSDKGVDLVEANEPLLDIIPNYGGSYKALFFDPNRTTFGDKVTDISEPGEFIYLNIN